MQRFVIPHNHEITKEDRRKLNGHGSAILWFTGLPSAGKSTLANEVEKRLITSGVRTFILDGDNVRMGLCKDLGFSEADRAEKRRIGRCQAFVNAGFKCSALVSPYEGRDAVRALVMTASSCYTSGPPRGLRAEGRRIPKARGRDKGFLDRHPRRRLSRDNIEPTR
jgi:adenylylsulfate kinase-like enzyme